MATIPVRPVAPPAPPTPAHAAPAANRAAAPRAAARPSRREARAARAARAQARRAAKPASSDGWRRGVLAATLAIALVGALALALAAAGLLPLGPGPQAFVAVLAMLAAVDGSLLASRMQPKAARSSPGKRALAALLPSAGLLVAVALLLVAESVSFASGAAGFVLGAQALLILLQLGAVLASRASDAKASPRDGLGRIVTGAGVLVAATGGFVASPLAPLAVHAAAIHFVSAGLLLSTVGLRMRLGLPALSGLLGSAMNKAWKPTADTPELQRRRALRTYVAVSVFVVLGMALAGIVATGAVALRSAAAVVVLLGAYGAIAVALLGYLGLRLLGERKKKEQDKEPDELAGLIAARRSRPEEILRLAVYAVTGILAVVTLVLCGLTAFHRVPWPAKYATDLFILALVLGAGPLGFFHSREFKRVQAIEAKFPDFLRDLAESARAGMTLPRALVSAAKGSYGALTPDIKIMAAQVEWGVEFGDALGRFAKRCRSRLIDRTVSLVIEAQHAGGSMVDILATASEDAREIKQVITERNTQMALYNVVVHIAFFVFIIVVLVLSAQFIPSFKEAAGAASGQKVAGVTFRDFSVERFNSVFFQAAVVQAIGGGLVGGVLTKGTPVAGFPHIAFMLGVAWVAFRVVVGLL